MTYPDSLGGSDNERVWAGYTREHQDKNPQPPAITITITTTTTNANDPRSLDIQSTRLNRAGKEFLIVPTKERTAVSPSLFFKKGGDGGKRKVVWGEKTPRAALEIV